MEELLSTLERSGWTVEPAFLDSAESRRLKAECAERHQEGAFRRAGVGRGAALQIREDIRGDEVMWIDPAETSVHQSAYLAKLEELRLTLNQRFFLGLFDFECHFAIYPPGAFYKAHLDRHAGTRERVVTVILYLNEDWQPGDGGELKIWTTPEGRDGPFEIIEPRMGTMVCFMAEDFWHEVLPATKQRTSITGWFRQRAS
ncbi:MAG: 2OG-Fe(II) oxygenase [Verrucomicrobiaceae bacterium]|nr:MAG: 2OG-Fe(II) oxygenase [Verrucomicrobiaceae bacterium]